MPKTMNKEQKIKKKGNLSFKSKEREQTYRLPTFLYDWIHFAPRIELWSLTIGMNIEKFICCFNTGIRDVFCVNRPCSQSIRIDVAFLVVVFVFSKHLFDVIEITKNKKTVLCMFENTSGAVNSDIPSCSVLLLVISESFVVPKPESFARTTSGSVESETRSRLSGFKSRWKNSLAWRYCEV